MEEQAAFSLLHWGEDTLGAKSMLADSSDAWEEQGSLLPQVYRSIVVTAWPALDLSSGEVPAEVPRVTLLKAFGTCWVGNKGAERGPYSNTDWPGKQRCQVLQDSQLTLFFQRGDSFCFPLWLLLPYPDISQLCSVTQVSINTLPASPAKGWKPLCDAGGHQLLQQCCSLSLSKDWF